MQGLIDTGTPTPNRRPGVPCKVAHPWFADQRDGTYCNPILCADYSDPDVVRVGDEFFLTASSFNCTPALPVLYSKDLVNWTLIGHALKNLPHPRYKDVQPGCGVWAPSIRYHAGRYWIFFPTPDEGIYLVTAEHPAGQWSEPHLVEGGKGLIDPCPLWDDDNRAYLVHAYAASRAGIKHMLRVCPMAPDGSRLLGQGQVVFHKPDKHPTLEGPKLLKRNGWYYILAPAGGVKSGWQVALRSRNVYGLYEDRIVLSQGDTDINGPHQGGLVDTPEGTWWFVHFQDAGPYGRITHLQPVRWQDDWPIMGNQGEPVTQFTKPLKLVQQQAITPQASDEFENCKLGFQWQWHANHSDDWASLTARPGWLRLYPRLAVLPPANQPNLLLQKLPAKSFSLETLLELYPFHSGEEAGLVLAGGTHCTLGIYYDGVDYHVILRTNEGQKMIAQTDSNRIRFRMKMEEGGRSSLWFALSGSFIPVGENIQAEQGLWIGAKVGLYSVKRIQNDTAGHVDVDYFRFS